MNKLTNLYIIFLSICISACSNNIYNIKSKNAAVFYISQNDLKDHETYSDFIFYYNKSKSWISDYNMESLLIEKNSFSIQLENHDILKFNKSNLNSSLGVILVDNQNNIKQVSGVITDLDLDFEIKEFLKKYNN